MRAIALILVLSVLEPSCASTTTTATGAPPATATSPAVVDAPLGLGSVTWPGDAAGARTLMTRMPDAIAGVPIAERHPTVTTYGAGGTSKMEVAAIVPPPDHRAGVRDDLSFMLKYVLGSALDVSTVTSKGDDPSAPLVWIEASGTPWMPKGAAEAHVICWAPSGGYVVYTVSAETPALRAAAVEATVAAAQA